MILLFLVCVTIVRSLRVVIHPDQGLTVVSTKQYLLIVTKGGTICATKKYFLKCDM